MAALPWLVSGLASLGGGIAANASNKKRAAEQMAFQERMSSTAYQRATEDMRLSGINPMLAYQQGGASSPGGAMATMDDVISPAVSSAMHGRRLKEEILGMEAQRNLMKQQGNVATSQAGLNQMHTNIGAEHLEGARLENLHSAAALPRAQFQSWMDRSKLGKAGQITDRVRDTIFPFLMLGKQGGPMGAPFGRGGSSIRGRY